MALFKISSLNSLNKYTNPRFEEGETVYVTDEEKLYVYHNNQWVAFNADMNTDGHFSLTNYELNKMLVSQLAPMSEIDIKNKIYELNDFERNSKANHYMLLCRDINYYSVFESYADFQCEFETFGHEVVNCAKNVGTIISIDALPDNKFEIWVQTSTDETYCMYLFEADDFIVPYRG